MNQFFACCVTPFFTLLGFFNSFGVRRDYGDTVLMLVVRRGTLLLALF